MKNKEKRKTIFIAGAGGYIGSKMVYKFLERGYEVIALDRYFFGEVFSDLVKNKKLRIIKDDIRFFDENLLNNVEVVINVAAISNDPASELDPGITQSINYVGAVRLAKNSKINAERDILGLSDSNFCVTILRLATVYGLSRLRMRFDLIVNLMTLHAWKNKKVFIMGGGNQWRPVVHIDDVVRAFETVIEEIDPAKINSQIFNIGSNDQNYQVYQVASIVKKYFSELEIEVVPEDPDPRDYNVNFDKVARTLGYKVTKNEEDGILEIKEALEDGLVVDNLRTITFKHYEYLIEADKVLSSVKLSGRLF